MTGQFDAMVEEQATKRAGRPSNTTRILGQAAQAAQRPVDAEEARIRRAELSKGVPVPVPPFWGPRTIARVPVKALVPYLNETMLYQFQWGFKKAGRKLDEYKVWANQEVKPILKRMLDISIQQDILKPQAVYGYWKAAGEGDDVVLFEEDGTTETARFKLPRQAREGGLCIADFLRDVTEPERDVIGLQVVTMGQNVSEVARQWFADNRYQDYLYLHGLGVEMAEAMAEYVHKRIRAELGFGADDDRDMDKMLKQGYRGSRYSFGYPACPNLGDQVQLMRLLGGQEIGVSLSDEDQLHPEQSTSAIVIHHPQAKYFSV
jgi:5-methyltetrahydrofolate--homocysteine methyltransferase